MLAVQAWNASFSEEGLCCGRRGQPVPIKTVAPAGWYVPTFYHKKRKTSKKNGGTGQTRTSQQGTEHAGLCSGALLLKAVFVPRAAHRGIAK